MILFGLGIILISIGYNSLSPNGIPVIIQTSQIIIGEEIHKIPIFRSRNFTVNRSQNVYEITPVDVASAQELFHQTEPIFIDARNFEEYKLGHIPGAINIPVESLESFELDMPELDLLQSFVTYCNDPDCDLSMEVAIWLQDQGFTNIYYFPAGWTEWVKRGNQVSKGAKP